MTSASGARSGLWPFGRQGHKLGAEAKDGRGHCRSRSVADAAVLGRPNPQGRRGAACCGERKAGDWLERLESRAQMV